MCNSRGLIVVLIVLVAVAGCRLPTDLTKYANGLVRLEPTTEYQEWYTEMEECVGTSGAYERVRWWRAKYFPQHPSAEGLFAADNDIILRAGYEHSRRIVSHEIVHHILHIFGAPRSAHRSHPIFEICSGIGH